MMHSRNMAEGTRVRWVRRTVRMWAGKPCVPGGQGQARAGFDETRGDGTIDVPSLTSFALLLNKSLRVLILAQSDRMHLDLQAR